MTNWNLEDNVTNLTDSKRLADAGIDLGADGYWKDIGQGLFFTKLGFMPSEIDEVPTYKAYRLDRLLTELPEWIKEVISMSYGWCDSDREMFIRWIWYIQWLKKQEMIFDEIYNFDFYSESQFRNSNELHHEFMDKEDIHVKQIRACDNGEIPRVDMICFGGQEAIKAAVDLLLLLGNKNDKNG